MSKPCPIQSYITVTRKWCKNIDLHLAMAYRRWKSAEMWAKTKRICCSCRQCQHCAWRPAIPWSQRFFSPLLSDPCRRQLQEFVMIEGSHIHVSAPLYCMSLATGTTQIKLEALDFSAPVDIYHCTHVLTQNRFIIAHTSANLHTLRVRIITVLLHHILITVRKG